VSKFDQTATEIAGLLLALERRRIAHPKSLGLRRFSKWITAENCDWRNGVHKVHCYPLPLMAFGLASTAFAKFVAIVSVPVT
jgi:hypothetical protein